MSTKYSNILIIIVVTLYCFLGARASAQETIDELLSAVRLNQVEVAKAFLARGMDVDTADSSGNTLLMIASREGHFDLSK